MISQAVLLMGGRGTRLWPLTDRQPKQLLPVVGLPFVEYQLRLLANLDLEEVILAVGREREEAWSGYLAGRSDLSHVRLVAEDSPLDTAGPVRAVLSDLDDRFLVLNGDVLFDADLTDTVDQAPDADGVLVLSEVDDPSAFGVVVVDSSGRVIEFVEKPSRAASPANTVSAGIYLLTRKALASFPEGPLSFERSVFPALAEQGRLYAVVTQGAWMDTGTPQLYLEAHRFVASGECRGYKPEPETEHGPGELDGRGAGVYWLGADSLVEDGAELVDSVLLDGGVVRSGARVQASVVGWRAEVGREALVEGYTLIGEGAVIGEGCELSGVRVRPGTLLTERAITVRPPE